MSSEQTRRTRRINPFRHIKSWKLRPFLNSEKTQRQTDEDVRRDETPGIFPSGSRSSPERHDDRTPNEPSSETTNQEDSATGARLPLRERNNTQAIFSDDGTYHSVANEQIPTGNHSEPEARDVPSGRRRPTHMVFSFFEGGTYYSVREDARPTDDHSEPEGEDVLLERGGNIHVVFSEGGAYHSVHGSETRTNNGTETHGERENTEGSETRRMPRMQSNSSTHAPPNERESSREEPEHPEEGRQQWEPPVTRNSDAPFEILSFERVIFSEDGTYGSTQTVREFRERSRADLDDTGQTRSRFTFASNVRRSEGSDSSEMHQRNEGRTGNSNRTRENEDSTCLFRMPKMSEMKECPICLDVFVANELVMSMPCAHIAHENCLQQWFSRSNCPTCPVCRLGLA